MQFPTKKMLSALKSDQLLSIHAALLTARNVAADTFYKLEHTEPTAAAFYKADIDKYNDLLYHIFNE